MIIPATDFSPASALSTGCGGVDGGERILLVTGAAGTFRFEAIGVDADPILSLRDGACPGAERTCNDDAEPGVTGPSRIDVTLTGADVVLLVDTFLGIAEGGSVAVNVTNTSPPPARPVDGPYDIVVDVPPSGAYGTHTFPVPARTNWVNSGLFLQAGQTATVSATGSWSLDGETLGPGGKTGSAPERGCPLGSLAIRSHLTYEGPVTCIGAGGTFTAPADGVVFLGMILSTDLGEAYGERLRTDGALNVTLTSSVGQTVPVVRLPDIATTDLTAISSGHVELVGERVSVLLRTSEATQDQATAAASLQTLDAVYVEEGLLRGGGPFFNQRVRFIEDAAIETFAYMLASNPIRCAPGIMGGSPDQRILRAVVPETDIWGFAHELGHTFTLANGTWLYMYLNIESWPNLFTIRALENLDRTAFQPNYTTYCDGKAAYLANPTETAIKSDPFLQLCFLMEFTEQHGWDLWQAFYEDMNTTANGDIPYDPDTALWGFLRDRISTAAGVDVTATFDAWSIPLP